MTTPKTPTDPQAGAKPATGYRPAPKAPGANQATSAPDALAGLPPMPKTKPRAKSAPAAADPGDDGPATVTKKELFTRVKARADGVKGREVRQVMDALLEEVGAALVAGEALKVPALGTLKVQRRKTVAGADVVICKLRRKKPAAKAKDPLAEPVEEG